MLGRRGHDGITTVEETIQVLDGLPRDIESPSDLHQPSVVDRVDDALDESIQPGPSSREQR